MLQQLLDLYSGPILLGAIGLTVLAITCMFCWASTDDVLPLAVEEQENEK